MTENMKVNNENRTRMATVKRAHKNPDVWREGAALATQAYPMTEEFPKSEVFKLFSLRSVTEHELHG